MSPVTLRGASLALALLASAVAAHAQDPEYWRVGRAARNLLELGPAQVLVEFESELKDPAALTDDRLADRRAFLVKTKEEFLQRIGRGDDRSVQRFGELPFLSLRLTEKELAILDELQTTLIVDRESVRVRIEDTPRIEPVRARSAAPDGVSAGALLDHLGKAVVPASGSGWRIVVVDAGIDVENEALVAEVVDGGEVDGPAQCDAGTLGDPDPGAGQSEEPPADDLDHGTLVAAMASWAAPGAELVSLRVGDAEGALVSDVISALVEVECTWRHRGKIAALVLAMANKDISKEGYPSYHDCFELAVQKLLDVGIPVVVPAGNDGMTGSLAFPATLEGTVSVAGVHVSLDRRVESSNWAEDADLCAPGARVRIPVGWSYLEASFNGTSVAAPLVAGAIATLREAFPQCSVETILDALVTHGTPVPEVYGEDVIEVPLLQLGAAFEALSAVCDAAPEPTPEPVPVRAGSGDPPVQGGG